MTTASHSSTALPTSHHPFKFSGSGGEYFRIWIVNVALTLITLGIYSAWAKVRNNRYIYGNTSVADGHFDYHADPMVILRGRIISLVLLLLYLLGSNFFPILGALIAIGVFVGLPWIVVRSLAFNARNTSWRNVRFNFIGRPLNAAGAYIGWPLVGVITFGLAMPFAWFKAAAFGVNNHRLGQTHFNMSARAIDFYKILLYLFLGGLLALVVMSLVGAGGLLSAMGGLEGLQNADPDDPLAGVSSAALVPVFFLIAFMSIMRFLFIAVTNAIGMLLTLGLFYPWAKVRMTRFLVESLELEAADLDSFIASAEKEQSALGEELGEAFDLGIGV